MPRIQITFAQCKRYGCCTRWYMLCFVAPPFSHITSVSITVSITAAGGIHSTGLSLQQRRYYLACTLVLHAWNRPSCVFEAYVLPVNPLAVFVSPKCSFPYHACSLCKCSLSRSPPCSLCKGSLSRSPPCNSSSQLTNIHPLSISNCCNKPTPCSPQPLTKETCCTCVTRRSVSATWKWSKKKAKP